MIAAVPVNVPLIYYLHFYAMQMIPLNDTLGNNLF